MKYVLLGFAAAAAMATGANAATLLPNYDVTGADAYSLLNSVVTGSVTAVPEPATWAIMLVGVCVLGAALRVSRKSEKQAAIA